MGQKGRSIIHLECTSCRERSYGGVSRYTTTKNKKEHSEKLKLKKYCPYEKKHTLHVETR